MWAYTYSCIHVCSRTHIRTRVEVSIYSWVAKQRQKVTPIRGLLIESMELHWTFSGHLHCSNNTEIDIFTSLWGWQTHALVHLKRLQWNTQRNPFVMYFGGSHQVLYRVSHKPRDFLVQEQLRHGKWGGGTCFAYEESVLSAHSTSVPRVRRADGFLTCHSSQGT